MYWVTVSHCFLRKHRKGLAEGYTYISESHVAVCYLCDVMRLTWSVFVVRHDNSREGILSSVSVSREECVAQIVGGGREFVLPFVARKGGEVGKVPSNS